MLDEDNGCAKGKSTQRSVQRRKSKRHDLKAAGDLKQLFDTYFKPPQMSLRQGETHIQKAKSVNQFRSQALTVRDNSELIKTEQCVKKLDTVTKGTVVEELRSKQLLEIFTQVNMIVKRKERRKMKLIKEAMKLQREADMQVDLLIEI